MTLEAGLIIEVLRRAGRPVEWDGAQDKVDIPCPFHDDRRPSAAVWPFDNNLFCSVCRRQWTAKEAAEGLGVGWPLNGLQPKLAASSKVVRKSEYHYTDETGAAWIRQCIQRHEDGSKDAWCEYLIDGRWRTLKGKNGIESIADDAERQRVKSAYDALKRRLVPPYNLVGALARKTNVVFFVEGEKDVDNLTRRQVLAITNVGGVDGIRRISERHLARAIADRVVVICPDNDPAGEGWIDEVAARCAKPAKEVRVLRLPGLPEKGDVSDWLDAGGTKDELLKLARATPTYTSPTKADLQQRRKDEKEAKLAGKLAEVQAKADELNAAAVRNFEADVDQGEGKQQPKVALRALRIREIQAAILDKTDGWPRRLAESLFVDDGGRAVFLNNHQALFSWLRGHGDVTWLTGRDEDHRDFVNRPEIFERFNASAVELDAISPIPLYPAPAEVYILSSAPKSGRTDGSFAREFLSRFRFADDRDQAVGQALLLTPFWGGLQGARPLILVTGRDGCGVQESGKTTVAELLLSVSARPFTITLGKTADPITKQVVSDVAMKSTSVLLDNAEDLRSREIAELITAKTIHGRPSHGRQRCRANRLTWAATAVSPTLDPDLLSRTFVLRIDPADQTGNPTFREDMEAFTDKHRDRLVSDCISILRDGRKFTIVERRTRFPAWDAQVLATHVHVNKALAGRCRDLADVDADLESIDNLTRKILERHYPGMAAVELSPSELAAIWNDANSGHHVTPVWMSRRLNEWRARGKLPDGIKRRVGGKRGRPWSLDLVELKTWIEHEGT